MALESTMQDGFLKKEIDIEGVSTLGKGLGTQIIKHTKKKSPRVVIGQDYRSYSEEIKSSFCWIDVNGM